MPDTEEWSANFDGVDVEPFLCHLASKIERGFDVTAARQTARQIRRLRHDAESEFSFDIHYAGERSKLTIGAFMDDIDAPDLWFVAPPALCREMSAERKR